MKKELKMFSVGVSILVLLFNLTIVSAGTTFYQYQESFSVSCKTNTDCVVQDIGDCCGYYPKCIAKSQEIDKSPLEEVCADGGDCKNITLSYCRCQGESGKKKCVGFAGTPQINCGDGDCFREEADSSNADYCAEDCSGVAEETSENEDSSAAANCPKVEKKECPTGSESQELGKDSKGCALGWRCMHQFSNGRNSEVKIMPEAASERARERLGELNFSVELKEVGKGEKAKMAYEVKGKKQGRFLGLFKVRGEIISEIDAESGEIININKPWWAFLATGV